MEESNNNKSKKRTPLVYDPDVDFGEKYKSKEQRKLDDYKERQKLKKQREAEKKKIQKQMQLERKKQEQLERAEANRQKSLENMENLKSEVMNIITKNDFSFINVGLINPRTERKYREIMDLMAMGKSKTEIIIFLADKYQYSKTEATKLYYMSVKWMESVGNEERENLKDKHYNMLNYLYRKALEENDRKEAREVLSQIQKLYGLNADVGSTNKFEIHGNNIEFKFNMPTPKSKEDDSSKNDNLPSIEPLNNIKDIPYKDLDLDDELPFDPNEK